MAYISHLRYEFLRPVVEILADIIAVLVVVAIAQVLAPPNNAPLFDLQDLFSERPKSREFVHCCWQHSTKFVAFCQPLAKRLIDE